MGYGTLMAGSVSAALLASVGCGLEGGAELGSVSMWALAWRTPKG